MAHGYPDWGQTAGVKTVYQLTDLAELAARLESIVTFDRRGDVILLETFEHGLGLIDNGCGGAYGDVQLSLAHVKSGEFAAYFPCDSATNIYAGFGINVGIPETSRIGLEFSFCISDYADIICMSLYWYTGTTALVLNMRYNHTTKALEIYTSASEWVDVSGTIDLKTGGNTFHTIKLVVDIESLSYIRLIMNNTTYDVSDKLGNSTPDITSPHLTAEIVAVCQEDEASDIYVDDIILTQNEP